jgi:metalloendopeptidase OMA1, mitochondrial
MDLASHGPIQRPGLWGDSACPSHQPERYGYQRHKLIRHIQLLKTGLPSNYRDSVLCSKTAMDAPALAGVAEKLSVLDTMFSPIDRRTSLKHLLAWSAPIVCGCGLGCRSAPVTGRKQLLILPEQQEISMGQTAFADVVNKEPLTKNIRYQQIVERVGMRIAGVSGRTDYQWEIKVVASDAQNAFCLPGGKIVVYEGILPVCQNEAGLAVVMSHEVAHVLARHGGERMSQTAAVNGMHTLVGYATRNQEQVSRDLIMKAYGLSTQYGVILPYSRKHELEADQIGILLMAQAGYDPTEAPRFWKRFGEAGGGGKPAEFMSTHPSDERRAAELERELPRALEQYARAGQPVGLGEQIG